MPDRKKVIKGVHDARRYLEDREWVDKSVGVHIDALNDALSLLKEQEAIPVIQREIMHMLVWCCGSCGVAITDGDKFCRNCGKAVKWEYERSVQKLP